MSSEPEHLQEAHTGTWRTEQKIKAQNTLPWGASPKYSPTQTVTQQINISN